MKTDPATLKRVYAMSLAGVYPHYIAKAEKKGEKQLDAILEKRTNIETFISKAKMNPSRALVTGAICGVRVEEIEDPVERVASLQGRSKEAVVTSYVRFDTGGVNAPSSSAAAPSPERRQAV